MIGYVAFATLLLLFWLEYQSPFMDEGLPRVCHYTKNILISIPNTLFLAGVSSLLTSGVIQWAGANQLGLLRLIPFPSWLECLIALLLFDLWMYIWHCWNHTCSFLWFFHKFHHRDRRMDCTTALRFHFGEIFLSSLVRLLILFTLGMELYQFVIYELVMFPVIAFHHSNVRVPDWLDRLITPILASPSLHRVHHSVVIEETNSNYGTIFSFWDRVFRTLKIREDQDSIVYGVD
jgi:sterol desaturase/sphingolipid hydroxylase (fatty acid hydroxylase superfamily)